jgi:hypothetical protein
MSEFSTGALDSQINTNYTLTIVEEDKSSRQITLESLKDAAVFDEVKHRIDQSQFFSLIDLVPTDPMLQCRKAELLIYIEEDEEAFSLLKDNPLLLARGLEAKLYISLSKHDEFLKLVPPFLFLNLEDALKQNEVDREGLVHVFEMTAMYAFHHKNVNLAKYFLDLADTLAESLKMKGRLGVIHSFAAEVYRRLNIPYLKSIAISGNYKAQEYKALVNLRQSWLAGKPKISLYVPDDYKNLVKAWLSLHEGRTFSVEEALKRINSNEPMVLIHSALLAINFLVKMQKILDNSFEKNLEQLDKNFEIYPYQQAVFQEIIQLYPLACLLAGEHLPRFAEALSEVPVLVNEKYRDGLRWKNEIIVLPVLFRRAWLEDDLYPSHMSHIKLLDKSTRHRALKTLKRNKILKHQIVSVVSYYKACESLSKLGYEKYEILRQKLKKLYPKSLKNL